MGHGVAIHGCQSASTTPYLASSTPFPSDDCQTSDDHPGDTDDLKRFACPFYKHNPRKYKKERTCVGPGFDGINRVKEYFYCKYAEPLNTRSSCLKPYKTSELLRIHQRRRPGCEVKPEGDRPDRMTAAQQVEVRSRKMNNETEEDKWASIYQILFGRDRTDAPSPYYDERQSNNTAAVGYYRIPEGDLQDLREHNPLFDLKCRFESSVGRVMGSASGSQLQKISD